MSSLVLIEFEDQNGKKASDRMQVPADIKKFQLQSLVNTECSLYVNGQLITETLEKTLHAQSITNTEEVVTIRLSAEEPATQSALFCSSSYTGHEGPVLCVKYNKIMVSGGGDCTVRFWDPVTKTQTRIVKQHEHWVQVVEIFKSKVVSGSIDGMIISYTLAGEYIRSYNGHKQSISSIKEYKEYIVSASRDSTVRFWKENGECIFSYSHAQPVTCLCTTDEFIVSGSRDVTIKVYKGMKHYATLKEHTGAVNTIDIHGAYMISGCDDGHVIIWKDFRLHKRMKHKREVISVSIAKNGLYAASGSFDKTVKLWSLDTGNCLLSYLHVDFVYKVMVLSDLIISCSRDKTVKMYRISKKKLVSDLVCGDEVYCFDYYDNHLVCGSKNNKVYFFN